MAPIANSRAPSCACGRNEDIYFDNFSVFSRAMQMRLFRADERANER